MTDDDGNVWSGKFGAGAAVNGRGRFRRLANRRFGRRLPSSVRLRFLYATHTRRKPGRRSQETHSSKTTQPT